MSGQGASSNESRTSSVGKKRHAQPTAAAAKKKRKPARSQRRAAQQAQSLTSASSFSVLTDQSLNTSTDSLAPASAPAHTSSMANLGKNRLAAGFTRPTLAHDAQESTAALSTGESAGSAIEISDDDEDEDMGDSEGGMVLNLQEQQSKAPIIVSDDDLESGEYSSPAPATDLVQPLDTIADEPSNTSIHAEPLKRLADLSSDELEDQMTYAFYYLERDQVDLNRPIVCLQCLSEGHLSIECEENSRSYIRLPKINSNGQIKLWISCCICASKEHLVGDCPQADRARLKRWSLASLNQDQIVNMSLESGTRRLETEAESRGMRPAGIQIRGRAGRHNAGQVPQYEAESSEEDFLHSRRPGQQNRGPRYDRYDAPTGSRKGGPGPSNFYATDSFGRRRSRSPDFEQSSRERRPSPPHRGVDRWQPPQRQHQNSQDSRYRDPRLPSAPPRPNIQIQLPERRGSNPHLNQKSQHSGPPSNKAFHPTRPKKKKNHKA